VAIYPADVGSSAGLIGFDSQSGRFKASQMGWAPTHRTFAESILLLLLLLLVATLSSRVHSINPFSRLLLCKARRHFSFVRVAS